MSLPTEPGLGVALDESVIGPYRMGGSPGGAARMATALVSVRCTYGAPVSSAAVHRALPVALLLVTAGCLGGPLDASAPDGPPSAPWAAGDSLNGTALARAHVEALREAGSFTHNRTARVVIDGADQPGSDRPDWYRPERRVHEAVDLENTRYYRRSVTVGHERAATFITAEIDATRRRPCPSCEWRYRFSTRPPGDTLAEDIDRYRRDRVIDMTAQVVDDWNFTYAGTVRRDGQTLYRYRANWTFGEPIPPFRSPPNGTGTLLVTEDGVIRTWDYRFVGRARVSGSAEPVSVRLAFSMRYFDVGDTTVVRPDWVETARADDSTPTTAVSG